MSVPGYTCTNICVRCFGLPSAAHFVEAARGHFSEHEHCSLISCALGCAAPLFSFLCAWVVSPGTTPSWMASMSLLGRWSRGWRSSSLWNSMGPLLGWSRRTSLSQTVAWWGLMVSRWRVAGVWSSKMAPTSSQYPGRLLRSCHLSPPWCQGGAPKTL